MNCGTARAPVGGGAGGYVKVLGVTAKQQVTHATANQVGFVPGAVEPVQHLFGGFADVLARNVVFIARNDAGFMGGGPVLPAELAEPVLYPFQKTSRHGVSC